MQTLFLERQRLVRSGIFIIVLAAGAALLVSSLLVAPPVTVDAVLPDTVLATDVVDSLELWLEEREDARREPVRGLNPGLFIP